MRTIPPSASPENIAQYVKESVDHFLSDSPTDAKWKTLHEELLAWIQTVPSADAFAGLTLAIEAEEHYQVQWIAGELLQRAAIPCRLSATEWIERVVAKLNLSADTVVRYGASFFGRRELINAVEAALVEDRSPRLRKTRLKTMLYFLHEN